MVIFHMGRHNNVEVSVVCLMEFLDSPSTFLLILPERVLIDDHEINVVAL